MRIIETIPELRAALKPFKNQGSSIGFVPTMGNLHDGHLALVEKARELSDVVVVSIFVNPLQLSADDASTYPRTAEQDARKLTNASVDVLFMPLVEEMYPQGMANHSTVDVPSLANIAEGAAKPGYFKGIATVVMKLFHTVMPDVAVFGEKDYQQLCVIRQMVADLAMVVEIKSLPTTRENDGLAMSSRNGRLTNEERRKAPALFNTLQRLGDAIAGLDDRSTMSVQALVNEEQQQLHQDGFTSPTVLVADAATLAEYSPGMKSIVLLGSAKLGAVSLLDNVVVSL